jgi:hypothetical protein
MDNYMTFFINRCPKCGGNPLFEREFDGSILKCLQCGWSPVLRDTRPLILERNKYNGTYKNGWHFKRPPDGRSLRNRVGVRVSFINKTSPLNPHPEKKEENKKGIEGNREGYDTLVTN